MVSACVASGTSVHVIDDTRLQVLKDDGYYWPAPTTMRSSTGEMVEVEPFPIVTALVVSRTDGIAMSQADEALARAAVEAHCAGEGGGAPSAASRFADGAWAFSPCSAPQG